MAIAPHAVARAVEVRPDDEHNARLLAHVHPRDWHNPVPRNPYNLVVVGAGPAGLIAAGDVCSRYQFTHAADALARTVLANALFLGRQKASALTIPWCTYTDPQIAHVGLTEVQATIAGMPITTFVQPLHEVDRAVLDGDTEGFAKVHVRQGTDTLVGATIVARNAGDMIGLYTTLMTHKLGLGALTKVIQPYPTQAEAVRKTAHMYNRTRLTPFVHKLMARWLAWQRRGAAHGTCGGQYTPPYWRG